jgi:Transposase IS200 like
MAIHVYTAMPDHVHIVAQGLTDDADLHAFMGDFKQQTGWQFRRDHDGKLWQGSFYDHVVRPEEHFAGVLEYVVNNPVRAGLLSTPEEYPFWDSFTQTREGLLAFIRGTGEWKFPGSAHEGPTDSIPGQPIKG